MDLAGLLEAIYRADVWMIQCGEDARLAFESRQPVGVERSTTSYGPIRVPDWSGMPAWVLTRSARGRSVARPRIALAG